MQRSPELEAWGRELFETSDPEAIAAAHSRSDDVLAIGTEENEWVQGDDAVQAMWRKQEGIEIDVDEIRCYEEGTVSWMAGRVTFKLPDGSSPPRVSPESLTARTATGRSRR